MSAKARHAKLALLKSLTTKGCDDVTGAADALSFSARRLAARIPAIVAGKVSKALSLQCSKQRITEAKVFAEVLRL